MWIITAFVGCAAVNYYQTSAFASASFPGKTLKLTNVLPRPQRHIVFRTQLLPRVYLGTSNGDAGGSEGMFPSCCMSGFQ